MELIYQFQDKMLCPKELKDYEYSTKYENWNLGFPLVFRLELPNYTSKSEMNKIGDHLKNQVEKTHMITASMDSITPE